MEKRVFARSPRELGKEGRGLAELRRAPRNDLNW